MLRSKLAPQTLKELIEVSGYFQRAVHLRYDLANSDAISRYVPTTSAAAAVASILHGTDPSASQRSHVLHAAYGSGKSLLAVILAAILENPPATSLALKELTARLAGVHPKAVEQIKSFLKKRRNRLLPVVLVGDEGDIEAALPRALARALQRSEIDLALSTRFDAALQTVDTWETLYPETLRRLNRLLKKEHGISIAAFIDLLAGHNSDALDKFETLYETLTAGALFDPFWGQSPEQLFQDVAAELAAHGYTGIAVIWDEFGRYLEARAAKAFSREAALLQSFAEMCNYSGSAQVHLILLTHKELQSYSIGLPKSYQQEWSRIEGRFLRHDVTSDPHTAFRLIASSFRIEDRDVRAVHWHGANLNELVKQALDSHIFGLLELEHIRTLIDETWPLHPLTVFALTRLSNRVAQNERTMFTFLTTDEKDSFLDILSRRSIESSDFWVRPGELWDYFADAIRADSGPGGAHKVWSGVVHALDKVPRNDHFTQELVKTLGVLLVASDGGIARPTSEMLRWAVGAEEDHQKAVLTQALENLRRRKVVIHRQIDGYWNFTTGSDIDFEQRISEALERANPSPIQLRRLLEKSIPPPYTVARRYNQDHEMTRFFTGQYRWPEELKNTPWDRLIERLEADGIVVYVLACDEQSLQLAQQHTPEHDRVILAVPSEPVLSLEHLLKELFGLHELSNDPLLKSQDDRERIQRELEWLIEDTEERLRRAMYHLVDPHTGDAVWYTCTGNDLISSPGAATRFVSTVCSRIFSQTPVIKNEGINKRKPTMQQIRASEKVIDALFSQPPQEQLGLTGRGPEILICNTLLAMPGILREEEGGWVVDRPLDEALSVVWDTIDSFMRICQLEGPQRFDTLLAQLTAPPYGLRQGVIPVLLAAVLRSRLRAATIRHNGRAIHPINGPLLTELVYRPADYTLEVGEWSECLERLWNALETCFVNHIYEGDRYQEPLAMIRLAMLRWLQSLPRFARDTIQLDGDAATLRNLIRKAQTEPAQVVLRDLPNLLGAYEIESEAVLAERLASLMSAVNLSYLELHRRLEAFALETFSVNSSGARHDSGLSAIRDWLSYIEERVGRPITDFRFGSPTTQAFVDTVVGITEGNASEWDQLAYAVTGLHLRDWIDKSEENFQAILLNARSDIELETQALASDTGSTVSITLQLPGDPLREYRFRSTAVPEHGQSVLKNLQSTMKIAGRPLSANEKRLIAVELLRYVMGGNHDE